MTDTSPDAVAARVKHMRFCHNNHDADMIEALSSQLAAANTRAEAAESRTLGEWFDPINYTDDCELVQVLCEVTEPNVSQFPRACELPISSGDHAISDKFVSIGWRDDNGEWFVAGWDMAQDCWTDARCFVVLAYRPLESTTLPQVSLLTDTNGEK